MGQNVIRANKLQPPIKRVEDVSFLIDKLLVCKWRLDILKELRDAWVGLFMIFGRNEDASGCN